MPRLKLDTQTVRIPAAAAALAALAALAVWSRRRPAASAQAALPAPAVAISTDMVPQIHPDFEQMRRVMDLKQGVGEPERERAVRSAHETLRRWELKNGPPNGITPDQKSARP